MQKRSFLSTIVDLSVGPTLPMQARDTTRVTLPLTLAVALLVLLSPLLFASVRHLDFLWLDRLTRQAAARAEGDRDIVLIDIDDYSLQAMRDVVGRWPWPRATHAELVEWLTAQKARSIAFDIWFSEPDLQRPEFDQYFGEVIDRSRSLFLPLLALRSQEPLRLLSSYPPSVPITRSPSADPQAKLDLLLPAMGKPANWRLGLINYLADADGIARRYGLVAEPRPGWRISSLPLVLAESQGLDVTGIPEALAVAFVGRGGQSPYLRLSYADVWLRVQRGQPMPELAQKTIFVGSTASGLHDLRPTPLGAQYPALYLLANAFDNVKNRTWLLHKPWFGPAVGIPLLLVLYVALRAKRSLLRTALLGAGLLVLLVFVSLVAMRLRVQIPVVTPLLSVLLLLGVATADRYRQERRARQATVDLFGRFLDPVVVAELAEQGLRPETLDGRQCEITVLFSDIRGFTSMSETADAAEIMKLLNAYFTRQVGVIFRHHGTLDKFIGDAIMAFWGAPVADPQHALHAVQSALEMVEELEAFRRERNLPNFDVGIGIHSGPAVVGMLGCEQRMEYTAIGDTVNLASRLEGVTKGIARILVSQRTADLCGDAIAFVSHGAHKVKGREEPVSVYEPRRK